MKITKIMKKTSESINPTVESKESIWQRVMYNTQKNKSIFHFLKKSIGYAFTVVVLLGVGTLTMNIVNPKSYKSLNDNSSPKDISTGLSNTTGISNNISPSNDEASKENSNIEYDYSDSSEVITGITIEEKNELERIKTKTAVISMSVDELQKNIDSIYTLLNEYNGYTENVNITQSNAKIIIKVPSSEFDTVYSKIRVLGNKIGSEQISIDDQQTELDNIQFTIDNLQAQIDELKTQLETETNADNRKNIENQVKILEDKITPLQKQKNSIVIETSYSTIEVSMTLATKDQDATKTLWIDLKNVLNFWLGIVVKVLVGGLFIAPIVGIIWVIKTVLKLLLRKK